MRSLASLLRRLLALVDHRSFPAWCILAQAALRIVLIAALPLEPFTDDLFYFNRGTDLAAGMGYQQDGHPTAYWPPGYPFFLGALFAVSGPHVLAGQLANVVLGALMLVLVLKVARLVFGSERAARLSILVLALYPNHLAYAGLLMSEVLYAFLLLLASWLVMSRRGLGRAISGGLVFGAAILTKAQTLFLPAGLFLLELIQAPGRRRSALAAAVVVHLAALAVVLPWTIRNHRALDAFVLVSTNGGSTLLTGNNPSARGDFTPDDPLARSVLDRWTVEGQVAVDREAKETAKQWIRENPGRFVALAPRKVWRLWAPDGEAEWWYQGGFEGYARYQGAFRAVRILNQGFYVAILALALAALVRAFANGAWRRPWFFAGYALALYTTLISIAFSGQSRFHHPVMPWLAMYAGWVLSGFIERRAAVPVAEP